MKMDFTTTACNRPEIVDRTYASFNENFKGLRLDEQTLYINIDPLPEAKGREEVIKVAKKYFYKVIANCPDEANYTEAYNWIWENAQTPYILNLEDDWQLSATVHLEHMLRYFGLNSKLYQVAFRAYRYEYRSLPTSPSIMHQRLYKKLGGFLDPKENPESQLKRGYVFGIDTPFSHKKRFGGLGVPAKQRIVCFPENRNKVVVVDIGRKWIEDTGLIMPQDKPRFTTWIKKNTEIDIITYIDGTDDYAKIMKKTLIKYSSGHNKLNLKCIGKAKGFDSIGKNMTVYHNSYDHGQAMNRALEKVTTDIAVIMDVDVAILYKDWDQVLVEKMKNLEYWGFEPPPESHRGSQSFPSIIFFAFRKESALRCGLDFRPKLIPNQESVARVEIEKQRQVEAFGRPMGSQIKCDTGWELPYQAYGERAEVIPYCQEMNDRKLPWIDKRVKKVALEKPTHMAEWHLEGRLFGTHKQACRNHRVDGIYGGAWRKRVSAYTQSQLGITV